MKKNFCFFFGFICLQASLFAQDLPPKREMRGVWIASVLNIDWPSTKGLSSTAQQKHYTWILDEHQQIGINAVFVQVRASADAFYESPHEPWSEWLTGSQGKNPEPYYDPLLFMLGEAHQRGMEFHAWLNPYRASIGENAGKMHTSHPTQKYPHWIVDFGGQKILNPGLPEVQDYIIEIVKDIVLRYDIDGIHLDDYFYPYPKKDAVFNDDATYRKYGKGFKNKAEWRRNNVSVLVEKIAKTISKLKPHVKFGISPFGVWRNKNSDPSGSPTEAKITCYDDVYADVRYWLAQGWIDYVAPQVYFQIEHKDIPYREVTKWWIKNTFGKHLYLGQGVYKIENEWNGDFKQIPRQMNFNRKQKQIQGSIFFSSKSLTRNYGNLQDTLRENYYRYPALIPPMTWKSSKRPAPPSKMELTNSKNGVLISWENPIGTAETSETQYFVIYRFRKKEKINTEDPRKILAIVRDGKRNFFDENARKEDFVYLLSSVDRLHNESTPLSSQPLPKTEQAEKKNSKIKHWAEFLNVVYEEYIDTPKK